MSENPKTSSLSRQLIITIILFSSMITLILTAIQLYIEFHRDTGAIEARLQQVESSYQHSIENAIWDLDKKQVQIQIDGIRELPDIEYAEIISQGGLFLSSGTKTQSEKTRTRQYNLSHAQEGTNYQLGILNVVANMEGAYDRLLNRIGVVLLSNALKTFLVALFITLLLKRKVIRHLQDVSSFISQMASGNYYNSFKLNRKESSHQKTDELDNLSNAINKLRSNSEQAFSEVHEAKKELQANLEYLQKLGAVSTALQSSNDPDQRLQNALAIILEIFDADRAWLLYSNDPEARHYQIPLEVTHPDYPGAACSSRNIPMTDLVSEMMKATLASDQPLVFEPPHPLLDEEVMREFSIRSQIIITLRPKIGKAWLFGLHQCRHSRHWSDKDKKLFSEIANHLSDPLGNYLYHKKLFNSRARLAEAQQIAHVGHWEYDTSSKIALWSDEFFRIIGHEPQSFTPSMRRYGKIIHPEDRCRIVLATREVAETPITSEYRITRPDGSHRIISGTIRSSRGDSHQFGIIQDITEQKQLEQKNREQELQLIQADKMSSLGLLVSGVAHEINNPNNLIRINASLLEEMWRDAKPVLEKFQAENSSFLIGGLPYEDAVDSIPDMFTGLSDASRRIECIINDLKNFARRGDHQNLENISVNEAIESAVRLLKSLTRSKTDYLILDLADHLPPMESNLQHMEQIVINLLSNALDALPDKKHKVWISSLFDDKNNQIQIQIKDNGVGIPESDLKNIFDPFFTTKQGSGGTGLGLAIAFNLTKEHGGHLSCTSTKNEGTIFIVSFPITSLIKSVTISKASNADGV